MTTRPAVRVSSSSGQRIFETASEAGGTWLGLKIAAMMSSILLCIIALVGLINGLLT
jgi:nucleoside permease NupC